MSHRTMIWTNKEFEKKKTLQESKMIVSYSMSITCFFTSSSHCEHKTFDLLRIHWAWNNSGVVQGKCHINFSLSSTRTVEGNLKGCETKQHDKSVHFIQESTILKEKNKQNNNKKTFTHSTLGCQLIIKKIWLHCVKNL